jgi:hypothetical protein
MPENKAVFAGFSSENKSARPGGLGQPVSNTPRQNGAMKNRIKSFFGSKPECLITTFGRARLVSLPDGSVELRGGQAQDQTMAKEWISMFMHEAVPRFVRGRA